jgi:hypothetical protein
MRRIGDIDDRGPVEFCLPGYGIERFRYRIGAPVVSNIGDPATLLVLDGGLVGAAGLKIIVSDEPHVFRLGRIADLLRLGLRADDWNGRKRCEHPQRPPFQRARDFRNHPALPQRCRALNVLGAIR